MSLRLTFLHLFGGCTHPQTYRERRELHGVQVLHLVCEDCGHAVPALQRTAEEHRQAVESGAIKPATVHRLPPRIVPVGMRRRASTPARRTSDRGGDLVVAHRDVIGGLAADQPSAQHAERVG